MNSSFSINDTWPNETATVAPVNYCKVLDEEPVEENVLFEFVCYGVLLNVIGLFGILGNVISIIILSRPQMKCSINYLLVGLAKCDIVLIISSILLFGLPTIYKGTGYLFFFYYHVQPIIALGVYPIGVISQTVSVYLTLTVTLERFVAVCHPLRARSLCTCGRAKLYIIVILAFSTLYNVTKFFELTIVKCVHDHYNVTVYRVKASDLRYNHTYISVYIHWMYLVFMYFIPFGCLAVLNTAIYRQVRRANKERQRLSRLQKKEIGLATMLLGVVVVFLICNVCALVTNILEAFYNYTDDHLVEIGNLMITINSSVNFIIYVIFGEKFKRLFFKLFFPHGMRICGANFGGGGRDSPDHTHDESFVSCNGDGRSRHGRGHHHHHYQHHQKVRLSKPSKNGGKTRAPSASSPGEFLNTVGRGSFDQTTATNF